MTQGPLVAGLGQIRFLVLLDLPRVIRRATLLLAVISINNLFHVVPTRQFIILRIINELGIMCFLLRMIHLAGD